MRTRKWNGWLAGGIALCALPLLTGCSKSDDGLKPEEAQMAQRLDDIAQKSGGDWNKVSEADRKYLIDMEHGSEMSAKMLLQAKGGQLKASPNNQPGKR